MSPQPRHQDIEALLGVYAIDALEADERHLVERHVSGCRTCRAEIVGHREVAALLTPAGPPPAGVWDRLAGTLEEAPPPLKFAPVLSLNQRRPRAVRILAAMAAVAAAAVALLGVRSLDEEPRLDRTVLAEDAALQQAAVAALADPGATTLELRSPEAVTAAHVALLPEGRGYLMADRLPSLPPHRTYQLWVLADGARISAGILGSRPSIAAFHVDQGIDGLAITEEAAGGVITSENAPVVFARLSES